MMGCTYYHASLCSIFGFWALPSRQRSPATAWETPWFMSVVCPTMRATVASATCWTTRSGPAGTKAALVPGNYEGAAAERARAQQQHEVLERSNFGKTLATLEKLEEIDRHIGWSIGRWRHQFWDGPALAQTCRETWARPCQAKHRRGVQFAWTRWLSSPWPIWMARKHQLDRWRHLFRVPSTLIYIVLCSYFFILVICACSSSQESSSLRCINFETWPETGICTGSRVCQPNVGKTIIILQITICIGGIHHSRMGGLWNWFTLVTSLFSADEWGHVKQSPEAIRLNQVVALFQASATIWLRKWPKCSNHICASFVKGWIYALFGKWYG